jgi:glutathione S-transferase
MKLPGESSVCAAALAAPFRVLDRALAGQPYLLGDSFTVADLNVAAVLGRTLEMDLSATPHLAGWLKRCLDRPAARKAQQLRAEAEAGASMDATRAAARRNRL